MQKVLKPHGKIREDPNGQKGLPCLQIIALGIVKDANSPPDSLQIPCNSCQNSSRFLGAAGHTDLNVVWNCRGMRFSPRKDKVEW